MRKSKLQNMKTSTGKVWDSADNEKPLNQLKEFNYSNYTAASVEEYASELKDMNALDLQRHATEVGEIPRDNRNTLIENLLKKFQEAI